MSQKTNNIAKVRKSRGLSQQELADKLGAHVITISNLERGKAQLTAEWAERLAVALQVDEAALMLVERPQRIYVAGELSSRSIHFWPDDAEGYVLALGKSLPIYADTAKWLVVRDDSLYPVFREFDVVRVLPILEDKPEELQWATQRLCIVKSTSDDIYIGYLQGGGKADSIAIAPISGPIVMDINPIAIFVVDRAIYQPSFPGRD